MFHDLQDSNMPPRIDNASQSHMQSMNFSNETSARIINHDINYIHDGNSDRTFNDFVPHHNIENLYTSTLPQETVQTSSIPQDILPVDFHANESLENENKRKRTRRKSSRIWDHFEVIEGNSKTGFNVICRHCDWHIQYSRQTGTSGCNKHTVSTTCPYFSKYPGLRNDGSQANQNATDVSEKQPSKIVKPAGDIRTENIEGTVRVAAIQMVCSKIKSENVERASNLVRSAAEQGAQIILLQELFESVYFCQEQSSEYFNWAHEVYLGSNSLSSTSSSPMASSGSYLIDSFAKLAAELHVVLPISFFERANNVFYNTVVIIDANGICLGKYRKSHIPDGPGYQEKFYFSSGDTGFKVFDTTYGKIGVGICWDQWFPEAARAMALQGAELLLYPTAIGSEPCDPGYDSAAHWERTMLGHAAANLVPVMAANRIGTEVFTKSSITFYGSSFISNHLGEVISRADRSSESILIADLDLHKAKRDRTGWGLFRDRRPELYGALLTKDGQTTLITNDSSSAVELTPSFLS